jgi:hypothetical protein
MIANNKKKATLYAKATVHRIWLGFFFVLVPLILIMLVSGPNYVTRINSSIDQATGRVIVTETDLTPPHPMVPFALVFNIMGWIYWLYCVYRMQNVIVTTDQTCKISASKAVGFYLIPIFNIFWVFKWTNEIAAYNNKVLSRRTAKIWPGIFLCLSLIYAYMASIPLRVLGQGLALAITLVAGSYLSRKIYRAITVMFSEEKREDEKVAANEEAAYSQLKKAMSSEARFHFDEAINLYKETVERFPGTQAANDAGKSLDILKKKLAG